jgi:D-alanine-D-alanine ligase
MKVVVLHGQVPPDAPKDEQDVLIEAGAVTEALSSLGFDPVAVPFSLDLAAVMAELHDHAPALVFNLVESVAGKGHLIHLAPALLDHLRLPYTGAPTEAVFATSNKVLAKKLLEGSNIATPRWYLAEDLEARKTGAAGTYIIKSTWEHASIGLEDDSVLTAEHMLDEELTKRLQQSGGGCFLEAYIDGREFNVALLAGDTGPEVLPIAEIRFADYPLGRPRILTYRAKWEVDSFEYQHTMRTFDFLSEDRQLLRDLADVARRCWDIFGLRGYARVDFRVDCGGQPWVLEINANPCLSPDSGFVAAALRKGVSFRELIQRIMRDAIARGSTQIANLSG